MGKQRNFFVNICFLRRAEVAEHHLYLRMHRACNNQSSELNLHQQRGPAYAARDIIPTEVARCSSAAAQNLFMSISLLQTMPKITTILRQPRALPKIKFSPSTTRSQSLETQIQLKSYIDREPKKKYSKTKLPAQITIRPRGYQNATPRLVPPITPAPSPWTHTTAATISDHKIERATARAPALLPSHGGDDDDFHVTTPSIRSNPPNRTRKLREEKKKKTHLPRHRAAFPSLSPPVLGSPLEHTKNKQPRAEETRERKKNPQNLRPIYLRQQHLASSIRGRFRRLREVSGGERSSPIDRIRETGGRAGRLRVCQGAPALPPDSPGRSSGRFRGPG